MRREYVCMYVCTSTEQHKISMLKGEEGLRNTHTHTHSHTSTQLLNLLPHILKLIHTLKIERKRNGETKE